MKLDGNHILDAPLATVWNLLLDPEVLTRAMPGVKTLTATGEDQYDALFEVRVGPVNSSFQGTMAVVEKVLHKKMVLKMEMKGKVGDVSALGTLQLNALESRRTEVSFSGEAKTTGTLARTGQRVMSGMARTMTGQFFKALEREVAATPIARPGLWQRFRQWIARLFGKAAPEQG